MSDDKSSTRGATPHRGATPNSKGATPRAASAAPSPSVRRRPGSAQPKGASQSEISESSRRRSTWRHHRQMAHDSLWRILRSPFSSLMTWAVLAIALALPTGLYLFLNNAQIVTSNWDGASQISLFLKADVEEEQARRLQTSLQLRNDIAAVVFVSKAQAMAEFRELSGFGEALDYLEDNPLPNVLIVRPDVSAGDVQKQAGLLEKLQKMSEVEEAQLDLNWVKRLYYIMELSQKAVLALALLLSLAVLLVVGNTIRLAIESRRDEIVIVKLIGADNAFVRRPFLYTGIWYGLGGGLMAWWIISLSLLWLEGPVRNLASVYSSSFELIGLGIGDSLLLILSATVLGWLGAWLAVARHLGEIEPR